MDFRFIKTAILAMGLALASNAQAQQYDFSETIQGVNITGSFTGTANGNDITGLSNISVFYGSAALGAIVFDGNGSLLAYSVQGTGVNAAWAFGGAVVAINGIDNNFAFLNNNGLSTPGYTEWLSGVNNGDSSQTVNELYILNSARNNSTLNVYNFTAPQNWSVTAVPEPEEWAMMLLGLPLIGWVARRKSA